MDDLQAAVARVHGWTHSKDGRREEVGAGFLVGPDLLVTCAHVVEAVRPGEQVRVCFPQNPTADEARGVLVEEAWRPPEAEDVAFLRLTPTPDGVLVLRLRSAPGPVGTVVAAFGFPEQASPDGQHGSAKVGRPQTNAGIPVLQLQDANDLAQGFSGSPLVDPDGLVVGMVTTHPGLNSYGRLINVASATPAAVLQQIGPGLRADLECPYPGLAPFTLEQARWFHGRTQALMVIMDRLRLHRGVLALLGPSGSGKSSLIAAGLPGRLDHLGTLPGIVADDLRVFRPTDDPQGLVDALAGAGDTPGLLVIDQFEEVLTPQPPNPDEAPPLNRAHPDPCPDLQKAPGGWARQVLDQLQRIAAGDGPGRVLLVLRNDFYPRLTERCPSLLRHLEHGRIINVPEELTESDLREIITGPADSQVWNVDQVLADRLMRDLIDPRTRTAPPTDLPLLALTLRRIWETATCAVNSTSAVGVGGADGGVDNTLTPAHYEAVGGLRTAFATWCDQAYRGIPVADQAAARHLLTALVQDGDLVQGTPAVRRRRTRTGLTLGDPARERVLDRLAQARIITTTRIVPDSAAGQAAVAHTAPLTDSRTGVPEVTGSVVELSHDTLIEQWEALQQWLEDSREQRRWLDRTEERAREWEQAQTLRPVSTGGRLRRIRDGFRSFPQGGLLLQDEHLSEALRRRADSRASVPIPDLVTAYIEASLAHHQDQIRAAQRWRRVMATVTAVALALACLAGWQWRTAVHRQTELEALSSAAFSRAALQDDPARARLYALAALQRADTSTSRKAVEEALASPAAEVTQILTGHTAGVYSAAWSPDGTRLATGSTDETARIWDTATGKTTTTLTGHTADVYSVAWSPDGARLATGSLDGTVQVWDAATGKTTITLAGHTNWVVSVAWSPDGTRLATGSTDKTARIWDTATGKATIVLTGHTDWANSVAWSPDGTRLATASSDGMVRVWDAATGKATIALTGHTGPLWSVVWSPDGTRLATGSFDDTARVWNMATGKTTTTLTGHTDDVMSVAGSPDGARLATASTDKTTRIWDTATGKTTTTLTGHTDALSSVAWSPDGTRLATGSTDKTARIRSLPRLWLTQLCAVTGRNLTLEEWAAVLSDTPYRRQCAQWPAGEGAPTDAPADPLPDLT